MKRLLTSLVRLGAASIVVAFALGAAHADEGFPLDRAPDNAANLASLQHGAQLFVNYCLNCHSANLMRYSRLQEIGLSQKDIQDNLLFTSDRIGNTMTVAMRADDAKAWFGVQPPDLSMVARARGRDWLYTYLRSFYRDDTRPTGWNNRVFDGVGMPHVLWQMQGQRIAIFEDGDGKAGEQTHRFVGFRQVTPGTLSPADYDRAAGDLVAYLSWMAEPAQHARRRLGVGVLLFLGVMSVVAWRLNAAYWKDIR